jgi:hypothetical protein
VSRRVRSGHDVGASRNAGGGYRGNCSEIDLPVNRALVVLLVHDQSGQYADAGDDDRQKNQQESIRTCPKQMHLMPPGFDLCKN